MDALLRGGVMEKVRQLAPVADAVVAHYEPQKNPLLRVTQKRIDIRPHHNQVIFLDPRRVKPMSDNPRWKNNPGFSKRSLAALGAAIRDESQTTPALVCLSADPDYDAQLVDGERRLRACLIAGIMIAVHVRTDIKDPEMHYLLSVMANFHREEHTCIEIAHACDRLKRTKTVPEIAKAFGKSRGWVEQHLALLKLHPSLYDLLVEGVEESEDAPERTGKKGRTPTGKLTFQVALRLSSLPTEHQLSLAKEILGKRMTIDEARRHVLAFMRGKGIPNPRGPRTKERFYSLGTLLRLMEARLGVFVDTPPEEVRQIFVGRTPNECMQMGADLRMVEEHVRFIMKLLPADVQKRYGRESGRT